MYACKPTFSVMMLTDLTFNSNGVRCAAWHVSARSGALAGLAGRPCVVMANGFGGTRDTGLLGFANAFADAGLDAFVFDYRGFGASEGTPRQDISVRRQRQDYDAAVAAARHLPGVDRNRIALWGTSYSAGHCIVVAAHDRRIAAVVSMTPPWTASSRCCTSCAKGRSVCCCARPSMGAATWPAL
ncbi:alpha/beta hydrolase [Caballeronia calidae]|uniref:alpha/beta hydrolase n=1 Tax=Caballeronia calidae TaxID=1777139 RepID=UPI0035B52A8C